MVDIDKLKKAVKQFVSNSTPSDANMFAPCTVGDLNKVIGNLADTLGVFIAELEKNE